MRLFREVFGMIFFIILLLICVVFVVIVSGIAGEIGRVGVWVVGVLKWGRIMGLLLLSFGVRGVRSGSGICIMVSLSSCSASIISQGSSSFR